MPLPFTYHKLSRKMLKDLYVVKRIFTLCDLFAGGNRDARLVSSGVRVEKEGDRANEAALRAKCHERY